MTNGEVLPAARVVTADSSHSIVDILVNVKESSVWIYPRSFELTEAHDKRTSRLPSKGGTHPTRTGPICSSTRLSGIHRQTLESYGGPLRCRAGSHHENIATTNAAAAKTQQLIVACSPAAPDLVVALDVGVVLWLATGDTTPVAPVGAVVTDGDDDIDEDTDPDETAAAAEADDVVEAAPAPVVVVVDEAATDDGNDDGAAPPVTPAPARLEVSVTGTKSAMRKKLLSEVCSAKVSVSGRPSSPDVVQMARTLPSRVQSTVKPLRECYVS
ncbi:hypothetical protein MMC17_003578 [Xylographa soralifera]|nr:hypothetical protein [Xylographa soralifera]